MYVRTWLDLECQPPFEEDESGSSRCPPRGKLCCLIADRFRPSEQRGSKRDIVRCGGGLLSSTINWDRSLGVDDGFVACKGIVGPGVSNGFSSGMLDEGFACIGGFIITLDRSLGVDGGFVACKGAVDPGVSSGFSSRVLEDGFACIGVWGGVGSVGFSCMLESDSGEGAVRSSVDAAQSQWVDRAPSEFQYWCAAR